MAASGRDLTISKDGTAIIGARTDGVTVNNSAPDVTNKSSNGFRELLDEPGVRSVDLSISGIWFANNALQAPAFSGDYHLEDVTVDLGTETVAGDFMLTSYEVTGEHDGAIEFTASLQSSGAYTVT